MSNFTPIPNPRPSRPSSPCSNPTSRSATVCTIACEHRTISHPGTVSLQLPLHRHLQDLLPTFRKSTPFSSLTAPDIPSLRYGSSIPSPLNRRLSPLRKNHYSPPIVLPRSYFSRNPGFPRHPAGHFLQSSGSPVSMNTSARCFEVSRNPRMLSFVQPTGIYGTSLLQISLPRPSNVNLYQKVSPSDEFRKIN